MDKSKPVADRVRPILEAMERSIDLARRRRLERSDCPAEPQRPTAAPPSPTGSPPPPPPSQPGETDPAAPQRLKARPKRDPSFGTYGNSDFRSKAS
jgi:hypothetical protein